MSALPADALVAPGSVERRVGRRLLRTPTFVLSAGILGAIALLGLAAPLIAPSGVTEAVGEPYAPPSAAHPLGLDDAGIDMLAVILYGARLTLLIALTATLVATLVGGAVGIVAGYLGGRIDNVLMRTTDYVVALPYLPLLVTVAAVVGPSRPNVILVIGLLSWTNTALVVRAQVRTLSTRRFVERSRTLGAAQLFVLRRHVLPHVAPLIAASASLTVAIAIFAEASLAFLGLGDPSNVSWGQAIANAFSRSAISNDAWWAIAAPGICIAIVVLAATLAARSIEDVADARLDTPLLGARTFQVLRRGERPT